MDKDRRGKTENFRAPFTPEALHVIELASQQQRDGHIFTGVKRGVISDASMARLMERRGLMEAWKRYQKAIWQLLNETRNLRTEEFKQFGST